MTEQLTNELTALFLHSNQELGALKRIINVALSQVYREVTNPLSALFDEQMLTLKNRNCPDNIIKIFQSKKEEVISMSIKNGASEYDIPFLPVIPRSIIDLNILMEMVHYGKRRGESHIEEEELIDLIKIPTEPYFIFGVEDGDQATSRKESGRAFLTVEESISLCVHKNIMSKHYVNCGASSHKKLDLIPSIYLRAHRLVLYYRDPCDKNDRWKAPSCQKRE